MSMNDEGLSAERLAMMPGFLRTNPQFFADPMIDKMFDIVLSLAGEVWSLRDRQMITEYLLAEHGQVTPDSIERFVPDEKFLAESQRLRSKYVRSVFASLIGDRDEPADKDHFKWLTRRGESAPAET